MNIIRISRGVAVVVVVALFWLLPQTAVAQTGADAILITELYYDTPGDDSREEWIEIANVGSQTADLSGFKIGDEETAGGGEGMALFPAGATLPAGEAVLVAQTAVGFRALFGFNPDFELQDSDPAVADMGRDENWARGDIGLANGGDEALLLSPAGLLLDAVNYGESGAYFTPAVADVWRGQSIERVPADCDSDTAADWTVRHSPTPGQLDFSGECSAPAAVDLLPIGAIQGAGDVSPYLNQTITLGGVVTGFYEDRNAAGIIFYTMFVQDAPGQEDGDPATSDGIAVFLGQQRPSLPIGQPVRVTGQVTEFFGLTEINDAGLIIEADGAAATAAWPDPVPLTPPVDDAARAAWLEAHEAMRVMLPGAARVVGPTHAGCGLAVAAADETTPRFFRREEADLVTAIWPILHHTDVDCTLFPAAKSGDKLTGLVGPLSYHFDEFKLVQQDPAALGLTVAETAVPPSPPPLQAGQISIATFNLENLFDSVDDTGSTAEPKLAAATIQTRTIKLAHTLSEMLGCPTLVGVQEVENDRLLHELAAAAAPACGFTYQVVHQESPDTRGIDVALLVDPNVATAVAAQLRPSCTALDTGIVDASLTCPAGEQPLFSRPPLEATLHLADDRSLVVYVNHFKSKRGGAAETAPRRLAQAEFLAGLVKAQLAADPAAMIAVIGDFNDYEQSPPLQTLTQPTNSGVRAAQPLLTNILDQLPAATRYTYVYGGVSQTIDAILLSPVLAEMVRWVGIQHSNADFPAAWQHDLAAAHLPFRSSDHDPSLVILQLSPVAPAATAVPRPTATAVAVPTATIQPTATATRLMPPAPTPVPTPFQPTPATTTPANPIRPWLGGGFLLGAALSAWFLWQKRE